MQVNVNLHLNSNNMKMGNKLWSLEAKSRPEVLANDSKEARSLQWMQTMFQATQWF